jgi:hypothetical protein
MSAEAKPSALITEIKKHLLIMLLYEIIFFLFNKQTFHLQKANIINAVEKIPKILLNFSILFKK